MISTSLQINNKLLFLKCRLPGLFKRKNKQEDPFELNF